MPPTKDASALPILSFPTQQDWEVWLEEHHAGARGLWLRLAKKGTGIASVTYLEALDIALCYGWIDSQKAAFDDAHFLQRFTPRGPRSPWSRVNRNKATALIAAGKMRPAGQRQVESAQADGRWETAYESQGKIAIPDDLRDELERNDAAKRSFATLDATNRYAILHRIETAGKPETRAARVRKYTDMLANGERIYPKGRSGE